MPGRARRPLRLPMRRRLTLTWRVFSWALEATDAPLAARLKRELPRLLKGEADRTEVLDALLAAAAESEALWRPVSSLITIEGFRGINNEGDPLVLNFKENCVTSVSAPDGVSARVPFSTRLALPFAEAFRSWTIFRLLRVAATIMLTVFTMLATVIVSLTLMPDGGGTAQTITVTRLADGTRTVAGPANAELLLADLNCAFRAVLP